MHLIYNDSFISLSILQNIHLQPIRREYMSVVRRSHLNSEYGSCDPSLNTSLLYSRDLDNSDAETWNSERIIKVDSFNLFKNFSLIYGRNKRAPRAIIRIIYLIGKIQFSKLKELRTELRAANERKNYYKDLYKRERRDRIRDRELRDLVEKKLMDDLRSKELECSNNLLRIKALEQVKF